MAHVFLCYIAVVNMVAFVAYGIDKLSAKRGKQRISEATLLFMALLGGSIGAWLGIRVWHHKTLHKKFKYGISAILYLQVALILYLLHK